MTDLAPPPPFRPAPAAAPRSSVPIGRSLRGVATVVLVAAVLADLSLRSRAGGLAATAMVLVLCGGLARVGWVTRRGGRMLLGVAAALSLLLSLRASPWLVVTDLSAIAVVMALACTTTSAARLFDVSAATALGRLRSTFGAIVGATPAAVRLAPSIVQGSTAADRRVWSSVLRGLALAAPLIVVLGLSLASADAVFASWFDLGVDVRHVAAHVTILMLAAWIATGWFVQASRPPSTASVVVARVGAVEALVVMVALDAIYLVYAASQLLVARRGPDYVLERTGLSYADYARSGFFQLLGVAAATALVLAVLRGSTATASGAVRAGLTAAGTVAAGLTLVVVHSALVRLDLYQEAFGLTLLRFASSAFAWWLGAVFVLIGASFVLHRRSTRRWLPAAIASSALVAIVALNLINPEATVVRHNVERARSGASLDVDYLLQLSDDAAPALADAVNHAPQFDAVRLRSVLCQRELARPTRWSVSNWQAADARRELCS